MSRLDQYCERLGPGFWAEPVNAISNVAFLIAALLAWRMVKRHGAPQEFFILPVILFVISIGSFLYHTVHDSITLWCDVLPILSFQLAAIALMLRRFYGLRWLHIALAWVFFLCQSHMWQRIFHNVIPHGSSGYLGALLALIYFALLTKGTTAFRSFAAASILFVISLTLRTLDMGLCTAWPLGTHWAWHGLNAVVLYLCVQGCTPRGLSEYITENSAT